MISITIPVRYRKDLLQVCLDSIFKYTTGDYEVIVVQEGEDIDISDLIRLYRVQFLHNRIPKGFAGAMNTGMDVAKGDYYCFLNSDIVAIPGWMDEMMKAFDDPKVGLVCPTFTESDTKQNVDWNKGQQFDYVDDPISLKGVCFLIRKQTMDVVGKWDESFGMGGGDDNDMCIRVQKAGYKLVIARNSYIYHYGSASFRELFENDADYSKKFAVGQFNKLREKHNMSSKPSIFISVPCADGFIHHELALRLIEWSHDPEMTVKIKFYPNIAPLDNARNLAVKHFLEDYCDYFLHIDDDIVPPSNALQELLKADKDVIAPLCFTMKQDDKGLWFPLIVAHRYDENKEYRPYYGKGIEETDVVTGGCHLVKRKVFEEIERPYYFTYHKNGTAIYSEDFVFSQQCQEKGYKLFTDYDLLCKHIRYTDIKSINDLMANTK
jgi:GT2 family glycosyltransferase